MVVRYAFDLCINFICIYYKRTHRKAYRHTDTLTNRHTDTQTYRHRHMHTGARARIHAQRYTDNLTDTFTYIRTFILSILPMLWYQAESTDATTICCHIGRGQLLFIAKVSGLVLNPGFIYCSARQFYKTKNFNIQFLPSHRSFFLSSHISLRRWNLILWSFTFYTGRSKTFSKTLYSLNRQQILRCRYITVWKSFLGNATLHLICLTSSSVFRSCFEAKMFFWRFFGPPHPCRFCLVSCVRFYSMNLCTYKGSILVAVSSNHENCDIIQ